MKVLDDKDKKILKVLTLNGRIQIKDIAKKTGIPRDSVAYRMKRMEELGIIKYYNLLLDPAKMGYPIFNFVNVVLQKFDQEKRKKFESYLKANPFVIYSARMIGKYHYMIAIAARNLEHFDELWGKILENFSDLVKEYDSSSIIDEFKYDTYYGLIKPNYDAGFV